MAVHVCGHVTASAVYALRGWPCGHVLHPSEAATHVQRWSEKAGPASERLTVGRLGGSVGSRVVQGPHGWWAEAGLRGEGTSWGLGGRGRGGGCLSHSARGASHRGRDSASEVTTLLTASSAPETEPSASPRASPRRTIVCTGREGQHISLQVHRHDRGTLGEVSQESTRLAGVAREPPQTAVSP